MKVYQDQEFEFFNVERYSLDEYLIRVKEPKEDRNLVFIFKSSANNQENFLSKVLVPVNEIPEKYQQN